MNNGQNKLPKIRNKNFENVSQQKSNIILKNKLQNGIKMQMNKKKLLMVLKKELLLLQRV